MRRAFAVIALLLFAISAQASENNPYRQDARALEALVNERYAYLDRLRGGRMPLSAKLRREADLVSDRRSLLRFAERALLTLADHHAITGASLSDSWAVVPSYSDMWIEKRGNEFVVDAVRDGSPAAQAGIAPGDRLDAVGDLPTAQAVTAFWTDLGLQAAGDREAFAARVLAAGRRDRPRVLSVRSRSGEARRLTLPNLYGADRTSSPVTAARCGPALRIKLNDSLGSTDTIAAFDAAMARATPRQRVLIDLTNTPGGGNTVVARAILGWFVSRPTGYQVHSVPEEQRRTGIGRQWVEQVLPREGKRHAGRVVVRVGRWTGSMGEGLAVGFDALGARVEGGRMAGLLGAIYDHKLEGSGLVIKLPTERLTAVDGVPRERFLPSRPRPFQAACSAGSPSR